MGEPQVLQPQKNCFVKFCKDNNIDEFQGKVVELILNEYGVRFV